MASTRYWVAIPGESATVGMTLDELAQRLLAGRLSAGTLATPAEGAGAEGAEGAEGKRVWMTVDAIPELREAAVALGASLDLPPSSVSAAGVEIVDEPPGANGAPTLIGAAPVGDPQSEAANGATAVEPTALVSPVADAHRSRVRDRWPMLAMMVAAVVMLLGSAALYAWYRLGYTQGTVLEHLPSDCALLEYVDFAAIDSSRAVRAVAARRDKALADWSEDLDDAEGVSRSSGDGAHGRAAALRVLRKLGLGPYGVVKEVAYCEVRDADDTESLLVVGGTFRQRDVLGIVRDALLRRDHRTREDRLKLDEVGGRPFLHLDENRFATAIGSVVLIGRRKTVERYSTPRPAARANALRRGEVLVRRLEPRENKGGFDERFAINDEQVTFTRTWALDGGSDDLASSRERFRSAAARLRKRDGVEALADGYDGAVVRAEGNDARTEVKWTMRDVSAAARALVDADHRELREMIELLRYAPGGELFRHLVVPGTDYFDLRMSPW